MEEELAGHVAGESVRTKSHQNAAGPAPCAVRTSVLQEEVVVVAGKADENAPTGICPALCLDGLRHELNGPLVATGERFSDTWANVEQLEI